VIVVDYIVGCACGETDVTEHMVELGERPPAAQLPTGWGLRDGKPACPNCMCYPGDGLSWPR